MVVRYINRDTEQEFSKEIIFIERIKVPIFLEALFTTEIM